MPKPPKKQRPSNYNHSDSPRDIQICLSCTKLFCTGERCEKLVGKRRFVKQYTFGGISKPMLEWCKEYAISPTSFKRYCVGEGVHPSEARARMPGSGCANLKYTLNGEKITMLALCRLSGLSPHTIRKRLNAGATVEEIAQLGKK